MEQNHKIKEDEIMKAVKVIIVAILIMVMAGAGICQIVYNREYRTGYIYTPTEVKTDNDGNVEGITWEWTGEKEIWSIDELRDLATYCRVSLTGLMNDGPNGLAFTILSDRVLVVPGLSLNDHISENYYLTF